MKRLSGSGKKKDVGSDSEMVMRKNDRMEIKNYTMRKK